jgi:hypothetical protein
VAPSAPAKLLTTRTRAAVAMAFTVYALVLEIRGGVHPGHYRTSWLMPASPILQGRPLLIANILFYGWICWIAFWVVRRTAGRERVFMLGFFADILPWPLRVLRPDWAVPIRHFAAIGLAVAVLAALTLLLDPPRVADIVDQTNPT